MSMYLIADFSLKNFFSLDNPIKLGNRYNQLEIKATTLLGRTL